MSNTTLTGKTWVAIGPAGVVGSVHQVDTGYTFKLMSDPGFRAVYPTLDAAKGALGSSIVPGVYPLEFREH